MENLINTKATAMVNPSSIGEVMSVPVPKKTSTYMPVPHHEVIEYVENELVDMLPEFRLQKNVYGLSRCGQALFGMITFAEKGDRYMGPSIAFRNSYDKSISLGFAFGSQVFICANGMLTGDILVAKKHTLNVWNSVRELVQNSVHRVKESYQDMQLEVENMRKHKMSDTQAYWTLGQLRGEGVLASRIFENALKEWADPTYSEHKDGTALQLYNACTEGLKAEVSPRKAMEKRIALHKSFKQMFELAA